MVIGHCLSFEELYARVKSSHQITGWLAYLELRDEEEAERLKKLYGDGK